MITLQPVPRGYGVHYGGNLACRLDCEEGSA
jgi:hypothetical protein